MSDLGPMINDLIPSEVVASDLDGARGFDGVTLGVRHLSAETAWRLHAWLGRWLEVHGAKRQPHSPDRGCEGCPLLCRFDGEYGPVTYCAGVALRSFDDDRCEGVSPEGTPAPTWCPLRP